MAARILFLLFAVCLSEPCLKSYHNNAYNVFCSRHIPPNSPTTPDVKAWQTLIEKLGLCDRPIQSFLRPEDKNSVKDVCTKEGGKVYRQNLCISLRRFSFYTVRQEACRVKSVVQETKHLILACDKLDNQCLPVHFEKNPYDKEPRNYARLCGASGRWAE